MEVGDKVKYTGCSDMQRQWGGCDDPRGILTIGSEYIISAVKVHSWHTKVSLKGIDGRFQSTCFDVVEEANDEKAD